MPRSSTANLTSVQGRDEDQLISLLELVLQLPLKLPICRVDEDEDTGSSGREEEKEEGETRDGRKDEVDETREERVKSG